MEKEQSQREEEKAQQQQEKKAKKRKEVFPFGNYRNYYGYRIAKGLDEDPRLKMLKKEWFQGKRCLDIGCNSGIITIKIAKKFHCQSVVGIDIDSDRIKEANWHLRKSMRMEQDGRKHAKDSELLVTEEADGPECGVTAVPNEEEKISRVCSPPVERDLSDIVSFRQENFVHSRHPSEMQYDTILCLRVTKWIHLNWGDKGLITLFSNIWRLLNPGGIFVLQPQPWQSYEKSRRVPETTSTNYRNIVLRPKWFRGILLDKIGFRRVEVITSDGLSDSKTGFNRPIFAFHK